MVYLHIDLRDHVDPISQVVSDYALFPPGAVGFALSALLLAGGTFALLFGLAGAGVQVTRTVGLLFGVWAFGVTVCAMFPTNLTGTPISTPAEVHRFSGAAVLLSLPRATQLLARQVHEVPRWRSLARRLRVAVWWGWGALSMFIVSEAPVVMPSSPVARLFGGLLVQGLTERVLLVAQLVPLCALVVAVLRAESARSGRGKAW